MNHSSEIPTVSQSALVIAGMHRSGTSLTAALLASAGLHIGDQIVGPDPGNIRGHFEDLEFCQLHQRILAANGLSPEGFTCADAIAVPARSRAEATSLIDRRRAAGRPWGWKDPRTTLFLDLWAELLPEARFLFLVRSPWEVVDSLFRRGDEPFVVNPRFALDLWMAYNRRIRDFVRGHPDRCMIADTASVATDPAGLVGKVAGLLAMPLGRPAALYEPQLLTRDDPGHRQTLVAALCPESLELLAELRGRAGLPPAAVDVGPLRGDPLAAALAEWSSRTVAVRSAAARELDHAAAVARSEETLATLRVHHAQRTAAWAAAEEASRRLDAELVALRTECQALQSTVATSQAALDESQSLVRTLQGAVRESEASVRTLQGSLRQSQATVRELEGKVVQAGAALAKSEAKRAALQASPPPLALVMPEEEVSGRRDALALDSARAEAAALADQLQAERACFEALRLDLVGRLEAATAGLIHGRPDRAGRGRKRLGQRVAAEYRRFVRRLGDRRRRSA